MFEPNLSASKKYQLNLNPHLAHAKIVQYVGENKRVLDVGCAAGYLAKELKKKNCYVVGIELDPKAAKEATRYCDKVITGNVEVIDEISYSEGFFDIIIYADVLEHLVRPDLVLKKFAKYLSKKGYVLASIPNVVNWYYRLRFLFGTFNYEESGILDKTHLRFFTLKTAKELFETSDYRIIKIDYTGFASKYKILRLFPGFFAIQFIIAAQRR
jgi:2-polyprenyl-3-methyl-5-hydroxy-6-metoxy-1,4-benzoquinol methylase